MAKGLEDTAFYRYHRLVSLNEVGGDLRQFGVSLADFHQQNQKRKKHWPHAMLCSSSHDSKRSEDVRARINVLSEQPEAWRARVQRWARLNRKQRHACDDRQSYPARLDEYLLYQTLIGVWPLEELEAAGLSALCQRVESYMLKAVREAKLHSSWVNPDPEYEEAISSFVKGVLTLDGQNPFLKDFIPFQRQISRVGMFNSLAQTLLKLTSPGVPDIYQGNELWDFSLVDPDNRRPVDYACRLAALTALQESLESGTARTLLVQHLLQNLADGRAKLYLIWCSLQLRRQHPALFEQGDYQPLRVEGQYAEHVCAFARSHGEHSVVTIVPRLVFRLCGAVDPLGVEVWGNTWIALPGAGWTNLLTDDPLAAELVHGIWRLPVGRILQDFPVALLWLNSDICRRQ
jgi:(1->4)-alpha-D-glucan 1-alpha-D-glucosylmutase